MELSDDAVVQIARQLFPENYHDGSDCRNEYGRIGQPCNICADSRQEWLRTIERVRSVVSATLPDIPDIAGSELKPVAWRYRIKNHQLHWNYHTGSEAAHAPVERYPAYEQEPLYPAPRPSVSPEIEGLVTWLREQEAACRRPSQTLRNQHGEPFPGRAAKYAEIADALSRLAGERDEALAKTYKKAAEEISLDIEAGYAESVRKIEALQDELLAAEAARDLLTAEVERLREAMQLAIDMIAHLHEERARLRLERALSEGTK